ncbi:MAG: hypothetical protein ACQCN3_13625 [Candidatus Bathyarchaeia archaeon]
MSDLANSCEYLNIDKTCNAFNDNPKAQASRQLKCRNDEKNVCCYLCTFRPQCTISCKYLGQYENYTAPKTETQPTAIVDKDLEVEASQFENATGAFCFSCNVEMAWARTKFTVDAWRGPKPALAADQILPVVVYLCPKCGKIEFRADNSKNEEKP